MLKTTCFARDIVKYPWHLKYSITVHSPCSMGYSVISKPCVVWADYHQPLHDRPFLHLTVSTNEYHLGDGIHHSAHPPACSCCRVKRGGTFAALQNGCRLFSRGLATGFTNLSKRKSRGNELLSPQDWGGFILSLPHFLINVTILIVGSLGWLIGK